MSSFTNAAHYMPQDTTNVTLALFVDPASPFSIPVGIIIGLLASFVQSLGLTIQRKSHVLDQSLPEHRRRVEHRRPLWLLGFAIFISSNLLGSLVQIASLPVVILAPLGAVSLLWNAFFARLILGDRFSPWMILGTVLIAGGAILIAVYGIVPEPTRSLEDLLELFRRPAFAAYFSSLALAVTGCLALTHISEFTLSRKVADLSPEDDTLVLTLSSHGNAIDLSQTLSTVTHEEGDTTAITERTPLLFDPKSRPIKSPTPSATLQSLNRTRVLVAISYASVSGILSGMCLIFAKSGVELLLLTLGGNNQFWRWEAWVLLLGLGIFALLQLWYLHKALILADPTLVCPSAFCFYNLSSIVNGLVYFNQISLIMPLHLALVVLGIFVLLGGVWVVSIQAGGGGVDVGPWSEENEFLGPNDTFCEEPDNITSIPEEGQEITIPRPNIYGDMRIGPVFMERETRSESSNLDATHSLPDIQARVQSLRQPEQSRRRNSLLSGFTTHRPPLEAHSTLPVSPTYHTRYTLRHRLTSNELYHGRGAPTISQSAGSGVGGSGGPLSPPMNPVSTLGSGFQIGLSPMSPGFTIMPKERKPRAGGLGRPSSEDVERNRRRTVSEGDGINGTLMVDGNVHEGGEERGVPESERDGNLVLLHADLPIDDRARARQGRWGWIGRLVRRGKE